MTCFKKKITVVPTLNYNTFKLVQSCHLELIEKNSSQQFKILMFQTEENYKLKTAKLK